MLTKEFISSFNPYKHFRVKCEEWPSIPKGCRKYEEITEYKPALDTKEFNREIQSKLKSNKQHKCTNDCQCSDLDSLGPYHPELMKWKTECAGRSSYIIDIVILIFD